VLPDPRWVPRFFIFGLLEKCVHEYNHWKAGTENPKQ
jgi:hypothetical protein